MDRDKETAPLLHDTSHTKKHFYTTNDDASKGDEDFYVPGTGASINDPDGNLMVYPAGGVLEAEDDPSDRLQTSGSHHPFLVSDRSLVESTAT